MDAFYRTHKYLVEHVESPVRRKLMDEIDWSRRLIGIKGSRGMGKTTFLLQYAKENFGADNKSCLYINLNNFYFTNHSIVAFADEFRKSGGKTLLIDQMFKNPDWGEELRYCYDNFADLQIIFSGSPVMRLKDEGSPLKGRAESYNLRGFSFREFLNKICGTDLRSYTLEEILQHHEEIARAITAEVKPLAYFQDYLHHGFYPAFLEKTNFSENLLKFMNMIMEVDILQLKQMELKYLPKIRRLFYLLAQDAINSPSSPNVSQLSTEIEISRATVMHYIKYMKDARLLNWLYPTDDGFPKKPAKLYLQNTNQMFAIWGETNVSRKALCDTFFANNTIRDRYRRVYSGTRGKDFVIDNRYRFNIVARDDNRRNTGTDSYFVIDMIDVGNKRNIPLWLFGFLY